MFDIDRVAFSLFGQNVYWYGITIAAAVLAAALLALKREKLLGSERANVMTLILIALPVAFVCARVYYVIFKWDYYSGNPLEIFNVRGGGMAIYGGIIGGFAAVFFYARAKRLRLGLILDALSPSLALGQAIGRWGNFFNQEAYGAASPEAFRFFPMSVYINADATWHYATFFYESLACFIIVALLLLAEKRGRFRRSGDLFIWYAALYSAERAVVEGLRTDSLYLGGLRVSQLLSAAILIACAALFIWRAARKRRLPALAWALTLPALALLVSCLLEPNTLLQLALSVCSLASMAFAYARTEPQK